MSGMTNAITCELRIRRVRATRLGVNESAVAALRTRRALSADTFWPLNIRETVAGETPAIDATS
jgi:hypothetical protein